MKLSPNNAMFYLSSEHLTSRVTKSLLRLPRGSPYFPPKSGLPFVETRWRNDPTNVMGALPTPPFFHVSNTSGMERGFPMAVLVVLSQHFLLQGNVVLSLCWGFYLDGGETACGCCNCHCLRISSPDFVYRDPELIVESVYSRIPGKIPTQYLQVHTKYMLSFSLK
jgi:hypothetical protein